MCGIGGILSEGGAGPKLEELSRMTSALHHRGPDERGVYLDRQCGLAHTRLSIIDLAAGQQPLANEDQSLFIVFNGEIFDYLELRERLLALGHQFRTHSDTEVIVHAYEAWGDDAFARMNGQWAVALWDRRRRRLVLARDRLGVRPLYFGRHAGRLYFASEVKALFAADPTFPRRLDPVGIDETFTFWTVVPPQSVFERVEELRPGTTLTLEPEKPPRAHVYYRLTFPETQADGFSGSFDDATDAVRASLAQATRLRMVRSDVPVGSYLSGGLDSSLVAALGLKAKQEQFSTFSLRFEDAEYDETQHQRTMVEWLGSDHHEVVCTTRAIAEVFPEVIRHTERPILRTAPAPLFLLSRLVRDTGIKVVLTGEGADEMFAGYDLFREAKVRRFCARQPGSKLRPLLLDRLYPYLARSPVATRAMARQFFLKGLERHREPGFSHGPRWRGTSALKRLYGGDFSAALGSRDAEAVLLERLPADFPRWGSLAQDQFLEIATLLSGYLLSSQGDRMLMANSVEGRFPFLDREVVALSASLPARYKLRGLSEKHVLKAASKGLIPDSIIERTKQPYRAPDAACFFLERPPEWIADVTSARAVADAGVFDPGRVAQLLGKCGTAAAKGQFSNTDNMAIVGVLSTQLLHRDLVQRVPAPVAGPLPTTLLDFT